MMAEDRRDYSKMPNASYMAESVEAYIERGRRTGDFLRSLFANDFLEVAQRADGSNRYLLREWAWWIFSARLPPESHGSYEAVDAWIEMGGREGYERKRKEAEEKERPKGLSPHPDGGFYVQPGDKGDS